MVVWKEVIGALLCAAEWRGLWLGVLDNLTAPATMKMAGLDLIEEFPFAHRTTIITKCAADWMHEDAMSVVSQV